jgi:hypothetical protein
MNKINQQPTLQVDKLGNKRWRLNGKLHREDGPAFEHINGLKQWRLNGKLHRIDGPAVIFSDGYKGWYLNGKKYFSKEEWFQILTARQQYNYLWSLDE